MHLFRFLASASLVVGLGSLAAACSSGDSGGTTNVDGACAAYASAINDYFTRCLNGTNSFDESRWKLACTSGLAQPGTGITPQLLNACGNALRASSCDADPDDIAACKTPPGTLAVGAACNSGSQCSTTYCKKVDAAMCGVCAARVAIGAACESSSECVEGARCSSNTCVAEIKNPVGGSCDFTKGESCQSGLYCDSATDTCKARLAEGSACTSLSQCASGLTCDSTSRKCVKPTLAGEGQACSATVRCNTGLACDFASMKCVKVTLGAPGATCDGTIARCETGSCNSTTKKCPNVIPDGGACVESDRSQTCLDFAECIDGKCQLESAIVCK